MADQPDLRDPAVRAEQLAICSAARPPLKRRGGQYADGLDDTDCDFYEASRIGYPAALKLIDEQAAELASIHESLLNYDLNGCDAVSQIQGIYADLETATNTIREQAAEIERLMAILIPLPQIAGRVWTHEVSTSDAAEAAKGVSNATA